MRRPSSQRALSHDQSINANPEMGAERLAISLRYESTQQGFGAGPHVVALNQHVAGCLRIGRQIRSVYIHFHLRSLKLVSSFCNFNGAEYGLLPYVKSPFIEIASSCGGNNGSYLCFTA